MLLILLKLELEINENKIIIFLRIPSQQSFEIDESMVFLY